MDSRIILTQADFSANNIGRYVKLLDLTKKVLAKQTQYSEDSQEALALDVYLNALMENGFLGGSAPLIKTLVIPALASNHDQMLYNIAKLDNDGCPTDVMPSAELEAETKELLPILKNDKLVGCHVKASSNSSIQAALSDPLFEGIPTGTIVPSYFVVMYFTQVMELTYSNYLLRSLNINLRSQNIMTQNGVNSISDTLSGNLFKFQGFRYVQGEGHVLLSDSASISGQPTISGDVSGITVKADRNIFLGNNHTMENRDLHFSILAFGGEMTATQMATFKTLTDNLMDALHVNA